MLHTLEEEGVVGFVERAIDLSNLVGVLCLPFPVVRADSDWLRSLYDAWLFNDCKLLFELLPKAISNDR